MGWNPVKKIKKVVKKVTKIGKSVYRGLVEQPLKAAGSLARGDISGATNEMLRGVDYGIHAASLGTTSGRSALRSVASVFGASAPAGAYGLTQVVKPTAMGQLRQGKGSAAGGSYTSTAKDPLGGQSGKTGK